MPKPRPREFREDVIRVARGREPGARIKDIATPACLGGKRACPPEDCGGTWGYRELLEILGDPTHPEHTARREWLSRPFDPDAFHPSDFDENLLNVRATFDLEF